LPHVLVIEGDGETAAEIIAALGEGDTPHLCNCLKAFSSSPAGLNRRLIAVDGREKPGHRKTPF
jgi:hypothetical protein